MPARVAQFVRNSWLYLLCIVVAGTAVSLPVALWGFCLGDPIHLIWSRHFADQLWSGELYPRWLMEMNSGLGSPTFFFYGSVPFYVTSLFHAVLPYRDFGWPAVGMSASLALVASGVAAFVWLRTVVGRNGALAGALGYMLFPYHLEIDHLVRFAFAECWAFVWLPLMLACTHRCVQGDKRAVVPLAVTYALLVMTHPPSTLIFTAVPGAYALFVTPRAGRTLVALRVIGGLVLGGLLAAIYLVPALTTQQNVSMIEMIEGYYSYTQHFLFTAAPFDLPGKSPAFIDYANAFRSALNRVTRVTVAFVLGGYLVTYLLTRHAVAQSDSSSTAVLRFANFWIAIAALALFMMSPLSAAIWRALPLLQKIQFPWRINILMVCAAAAVFATACDSLIEYAARARRNVAQSSSKVFLSSAIVTAAVLLLLATQVLSAVKTIQESLAAERSVPPRVLIQDYAEYRPSTLRKEYFVQEVIQQLGQSLPPAAIAAGSGSVRVVSWRPRHIVLAVDAATDVQLTLKQLYYPGWSARSRDGGAALQVMPSEPEALVQIAVPPGSHEIDVSLDATAPERAGQIVSALALVALLAIAWHSRRGPNSRG